MRCICVMGPSQAGKTTLVDRLAALDGAAGTREPLGDGLELVRFAYLEEPWAAIDTPGSVEALPDIRQALIACDAALVVVPPDPAAALLAAPHLLAAEDSGTPTILFVNRMDAAEATMREVIGALQDYAAHALVLRQVPIRGADGVVGAVDLVSERAWEWHEDGPSSLIEIPEAVRDREHEAREALLDGLSEADDWLLEELIEDREPAAGPLYDICAKVMREGRITPALLGSALHGNGLRRLMKALRHEAPGPQALADRLAAALPGTEPPRAVAFRAEQRRHVGKVTWLRALAPGLAQGTPLAGAPLGGFLGGGSDAPEPGGIVAAVKSDHLPAGRVMGEAGAFGPPDWAVAPTPMVARTLEPAHEKDEAKLSAVVARLAEDQPGLTAGKEPATGRVLVRVQGPVHLRRLEETLADTFGVAVETHAPAEEWLETITREAETRHRHRKQTGGAGQFAEVALRVSPNPRGEGFSFDSQVKGGAVPRQFFGAVEAGARDALAKGPLGAPVTDVHVVLLDGRAHAVDSNDFAFRTAARVAVEQALAEAGPVRLQPIHEVAIRTPSVFGGGLSPMISALKGQVLSFERDPTAKGWDLFRALLPGAALDRLPQALRAETQGVAWFEAAFHHHEELHGRAAERGMAMEG